METQTNLEAVLNKIALLKNLASKPGTPAEAASALAMIGKLTLKYNLSQVEVDGARRLGMDGPKVERQYYQATAATWQGSLLNGIAEVNFARVVYLDSGRFAIIGHPYNIAIVTGLFEYLRDEIDRLADLAWKRGQEKNAIGWWETPRVWKGSFRLGAKSEVLRRLREDAKAARAAEDSSSALVPVVEAEVEAALADYYPKLTSRTSRAKKSSQGYASGRAAGAGINLARQIEG